MFAFRVHIVHDESPTAPAVSSSFAFPARPGMPLEVSFDRPFGFCFELGNRTAIGESIVPVEASRIENILAELHRTKDSFRLLKNDIMTLIVIDGSAKTVTAISNIASCRPCYYYFRKDKFLCSSSIHSLMKMGIALEPNEASFPEFFVYRYVIPPRTLYRNVNKLVAGQLLRFDLTDGQLLDSRRFDFAQSSDTNRGDDMTARQRLDTILRNQMSLSMNAATKPGVLLSGGLDSSVLACIAVSLQRDIGSVSSGFSFVDRGDAENEYALSVARHLKIPHRVYEGSEQEYLSGLVESIYFAEGPVHHLQSVMLYLLFKNCARERFDSLICGEGADGLFGNSTHIKLYKYRHLISFMRYSGASRVYRGLSRLLKMTNKRWGYFGSDFGTNLDSDYHIHWSDGQYTDPRLVKTYFGCSDEDILSQHKSLMTQYQNESLLDRVTIHSLLCECFMTTSIWSKLAESQKIAIHYPFTSLEMIDYITNLTWSKKLRENKYFIRQLLRHYRLPEPFITRKKMSFGFPYRFWALPGTLFQPLVDMAQERFDGALLRSLQTGEGEQAMLLWNIINLHLWHKLFIDGVGPEDLSREVIDRHRASAGKG